jgi:bla regulator protein blaR1
MTFWANHLWQSTFFAAAAGLLTLTLRGNRASVRYALWLAASLKFLVPFSLLAAAAARLEPPASLLPLPAAQMIPVISHVSQPFLYSAPASGSAPSRWPEVLASVWLCGMTFHLYRWSRQWLRVRAAARDARPLPAGAPIPVLSTSAGIEPGIFGILRPVLLLPEGIADSLTPSQLDAILIHELAHVRRRDNLAAAAHMLVETLFWFYPLVWWIEARLVEERERACDEEVLRYCADAESYAEGILQVCRRYVESPLPCVSGVTGSDLKKRITAILTPRAVRNLGAGKKLLLAGAALVCVAAPVVIGQAKPQFAVASVKLDSSGPPWRIGLETHPGGRVHFTGGLVFLLSFAYDVPFNSKRITGVPDWGYNEGYVIDAAPDPGAIPAGLATAALHEKVRPMLQTLLADRFKLVMRRDTQQAPVYALTLAKGGPKLMPAGIDEKDCSVDGKIACHSMHGGITGISGQAVNLDDIAQFVSNWTDLPVVNRTGNSVLYQIQTEGFGPMVMGSAAVGRNPNEAEALGDPNRPSIAMILRELGLNLQPAKTPLDMYVIEHVERPTAN